MPDTDERKMGGSRETSHAAETVSVVVVVSDERRILGEALTLLLCSMPNVRAQAITDSQLTAAAMHELRPNIVLLSTEAGAYPLSLPPALATADAGFQIVLLADAVTPELVQTVLDHRLGGLLLTDLSAADFAVCLEQIARGRAVLPQAWQRAMTPRPDDPLDLLSHRQVEVLELLVAGRSYEEIAKHLFISVNTVKFHVRSVFAHLGIHNRFEAAHLFEAAGRQRPPGLAHRRIGSRDRTSAV